jgi:hypothetical protein
MMLPNQIAKPPPDVRPTCASKNMSFTPDTNIQKIAEAYSLDACDFLRDHFRITLDSSDASIQQIESALDTFHR